MLTPEPVFTAFVDIGVALDPGSVSTGRRRIIPLSGGAVSGPRLAAEEPVDPSLYYFRTSPVFEVSPGPHDWFSENIFVAPGERHQKQVVIRIYLLT